MWRDVPIFEIVRLLEGDNLLPAIVFRTARSQCDRDAEQGMKSRSLRLDEGQRQNILETTKKVAARYDWDYELISTHPHYNSLINSGIGAHHAGQLLVWRLLLEELMAAGILRVLVATGTVAAGVDFPARSVVITAHSKRGAEGYNVLTAAEFQQMSGRAGRRGKDSVGFCLVAPSAFCDARVVSLLAKQQAEPLVSAYFPSPSSVLNLLRYRNVDDLRYTVARSLAAFIDAKEANELRAQAAALVSDESHLSTTLEQIEKKRAKKYRRLEKQADELQKRQETLLERTLFGLRSLGYVEGESLSAKGYWSAALCTNLVIELAETIEEGLFAPSSVERVVALVAALSGDSYRKYLKGNEAVLPKEVFKSLRQIVARVDELQLPGAIEKRDVLPDAAYTVIAWLHAVDWQSYRSLLLLLGVAEGDAARLITQTAEHLNQLSHLKETHPELALTCERARRALLRPPLTDLETP